MAHAKSDLLERPLHFLTPRRRELYGLARALLTAEQTVSAHAEQWGVAFVSKPKPGKLKALAARTFLLTSVHPQPRLRSLVQQLQSDRLVQSLAAKHGLRLWPPLASRFGMRPLPGIGPLLPLNTVRDLADWLRLDPELVQWYADLKDRNGRANVALLGHYEYRFLPKSDGSLRLLEMPKRQLKRIQRTILHDLLNPIPMHDAVHGFRKGRSIVTFAKPHAGRGCVLRMDLQDFFASISGPRVQALFRTLGYPEPVADLLGGLCTSTAPRRIWIATGLELQEREIAQARMLYARPHLPQGAPTSPCIANLCAFRLDARLSGLANTMGVAYTRYADDLAFSGEQFFARRGDRFARHVAAIASGEGFSVHHRKTRLMRSSVRQHLAGLTVNAHPNLPRRELDCLEATLTNCVRYGAAAQNRDGHPEFRRHLEGKVAYVEMLQATRAGKLRRLLEEIVWAE